jgi:rhodanese-related sulfurtransferase
MTALPAARKLFKAGFTQVTTLKGGFSSWQSASLPVTKK